MEGTSFGAVQTEGGEWGGGGREEEEGPALWEGVAVTSRYVFSPYRGVKNARRRRWANPFCQALARPSTSVVETRPRTRLSET